MKKFNEFVNSGDYLKEEFFNKKSIVAENLGRHSNPELNKQYQTLNEDGSFKIMNSNKLNVDFSYVILDDDTDMLYDQKDNFIHTECINGLTKELADKAIKILNYELI